MTTYFEIFGLHPRLVLDTEMLRDQFLDLSRQYHPDFHATASQAERDEALRKSSLLNNAYKALRDPQKRAEYLIATYGLGIESNKNAVPPELLEEMFDIQEAGEELREARLAADEAALTRAEARIAPLRQQAMAARQGLEDQLLRQFADYDRVAEEVKNPGDERLQAILRQIRLTLDRMNYLRTVLRNLK